LYQSGFYIVQLPFSGVQMPLASYVAACLKLATALSCAAVVKSLIL